MQNPATTPSQPQLGTPVPGTTGGLSALGGLSVTKNPMAEQLRSYGRGEDSMLVHMTPDEVNSLQGLAMATGGSLTINPHTGLPEAGWLGKLLPTILGVAGAAFGIPTWAIGLGVGAGQTAITGDITKGLTAGLQAFGGAGLGQAAGIGGKLGSLGKDIGLTQSATGASNALTAANASKQLVGDVTQQITSAGGAIPKSAAAALAKEAAKTPGLLGKFGLETSLGMKGMLGKALPAAAGMSVLGAVSEATAPTGYKTSSGQIDNSYTGPYRAQERPATFAPTTEEVLGSSKERDYFNIDQPEIMDIQGRVVQPGSHTTPGTMIYQNVLNPKAKKGQNMYSLVGRPYLGGLTDPNDPQAAMGYARGGGVNMRDGAFVVDARTVSELGNGSSNAGIEALMRMGGKPVRGPGDGVSDSVPAKIGGKQEARVARDEVIFQPEAVRRIGGGSEKRGTQKLYALMDKAHKARKKAKRGQDTGVRRGLA